MEVDSIIVNPPENTFGVYHRACSGDIFAFGAIFSRYAESVYGFFHALIPDEIDAEDITEETFVKLWLNINKNHSTQKQFRHKLFNIASRLLVSRIYELSWYDDPKALLFPLRDLSLIHCQIFMLVEVLGYSIAEAAIMIDRPELEVLMYNEENNHILEGISDRKEWLTKIHTFIQPTRDYELRATSRLIELIKAIQMKEIRQQFEQEREKKKRDLES